VNTFAFILSAGLGLRFRYDIPKQLAVLGKETILARQLRQLKNFGITPFVATNDLKISEASPCVIHPKESDTILHTLKSTENYWSERNYIILGDVFFSTTVFLDMMICDQDIKFWMNGSEIFAMAFDGNASYSILDDISLCISECALNSRMWHLYRSLSGLDLHKLSNQATVLSGPIITDYTTDVDSDNQYVTVQKMFESMEARGIVL